jgi:hypothetical protein
MLQMTSNDNSEECAIHRLEGRTGEVMEYVFVFSIFNTRTTYSVRVQFCETKILGIRQHVFF